MKSIYSVLLLLCLSLLASRNARAQAVGCANDTLFINTGLDHTSNTLESIGSLDGGWIVQSGPGTSQLAFPVAATVLSQYVGWHYTLPNSQWLSPFNYASYATNNVDTPYDFRYSFCLAQPTTVQAFISLFDDDSARVYVDGTLIGLSHGGYNFVSGNQDTIVYTLISLSTGTHNLDVHLYNTGGVALGLDLTGFLTGVGMQGDTCCHVSGCCCGNVYDDHNCDGSQDPGNGFGGPNDGGVHGCRVAMTGTGGGTTLQTTTDRLGNYSFIGVAPGLYNLVTKTPTGTTVDSTTVNINKDKSLRKDIAVCSSLLAVNNTAADQSYFRCYPNPATSQVQIDYAVVEPSAVSLHITNVQGQDVMTPVQDENKSVGQYHQTVNISQLPAGLYFYEFKTDRTYTGKFVKQ